MSKTLQPANAKTSSLRLLSQAGLIAALAALVGRLAAPFRWC